jgi:predicted RNA binding protein YcfA (HicA-like mRNA interferase family)
VSMLVDVTGKALLKILKSLGCEEVRQESSHVRVRCGRCLTTVPVHAGEDLGKGLLRAIERSLEPCLGKTWLKRIPGRQP